MKQYFVDEHRTNYVYDLSETRSFSAREVDLPQELCAAISLHYKRDRLLNEYLSKVFNSPLRHHRTHEVPPLVQEMVDGVEAKEPTKSNKGKRVSQQVRGGGSGGSNKA